MTAINKIIGVCGGRGTGKTHYLKSLAKVVLKTRPQMSVIVVETFATPAWDDLSTYDDPNNITPVPIIPVDEIPNWKKTSKFSHHRIVRTAESDVSKTFDVVMHNVYNCLVIIEDATRYIRTGRLSDSQVAMILDSKQKNLDIIFVFHLINKIPLELCTYLEYITLMKTGEIWSRDIEKRFPHPSFKKAFNQLKASQNRFQNISLNVSA